MAQVAGVRGPAWERPIRAVAAVLLGDGERGVRLEGTMSVDHDYPVFGARLRLRFAGAAWSVALPSLQVVPRMVNGVLAVELRMRLLAGNF